MADGIRLKFDVKKLSADLQARLALIANPETLLRPVAFDLVAQMTERIHERGTGSDGAPIKAGGYSEGYLRYRQEKHNRSADPKVIISLTRQLENDWSVVAFGKGYGIGFKNPFNYQKAGWMHDLFGDRIFKLSADEKAYAQKRFKELISEQFNS